MTDSELRRGIAWAGAAAAFTALMSIPWKLAADCGDPRVNTLILLAVAASLGTGLTASQRRALPRFSRFDFGFATGIALLTLGGNLASAEAVERLSPSLWVLVQRSEVIFVALIAWPLIGERPDRRFWLGATVAGVGLWLLTRPAGGGTTAAGILSAVLSAVLFGGMVVLTRKYVQRIDTMAVNSLRLWLSVGLWFAFNGAPAALFEITGPQLLYAGLAAFFGPFAGRLSLMYSAKYIEARLTILISLVAPPLTLLLGFAVLGNLPGSSEVLGGLVMLCGISIPLLVRGGTLPRARKARLRHDAETNL